MEPAHQLAAATGPSRRAAACAVCWPARQRPRLLERGSAARVARTIAARPCARSDRRESVAPTVPSLRKLFSAAEDHALMMRHERAHHAIALARRQTRPGKVDCFIEAVAARRRRAVRSADEVAQHRGGSNGSANTDAYGVTTNSSLQTALETERRHTEGTVLIVQLRIDAGIARLRDAPRDTALARAYAICSATAAAQLSPISVSRRSRSNKAGIKYSNIVPLHDSSVRHPSTRPIGRPRCSQCSSGTSPLAIATKLARRASEARRS